MTKQTVSEQFHKKKCTEIAFFDAVCLLNSTLFERSHDLSNYGRDEIERICRQQYKCSVDYDFCVDWAEILWV